MYYVLSFVKYVSIVTNLEYCMEHILSSNFWFEVLCQLLVTPNQNE